MTKKELRTLEYLLDKFSKRMDRMYLLHPASDISASLRRTVLMELENEYRKGPSKIQTS